MLKLFDVMFDLETLSTQPDAVVMSFAAVAFDRERRYTWEEIQHLDQMTCKIDINSQVGRHIDGSTLHWWMRQSPEAQAGVIPLPGHHPIQLRRALLNFREWYKNVRGGVTWSHGAAFDHAIIDSAYAYVGIENPIHYKDRLCMRTVTHLTQCQRPDVQSTTHDALEDCRFQILWLQDALRKWQPNVPLPAVQP